MKKSKRKIITTAAIAIMLVAIAALYWLNSTTINAEVYPVSKGDIRQYIDETAQAQPIIKQTMFIEATGKIKGIMVEEGDRVEKGDVLLSLDKSELQLELRDAEAKVNAARSQLKGTELINYSNSIEIANAVLRQAQNEFDSVSRDYARAKELFEAAAITKLEFEIAQDRYKAAESALEVAELKFEEVKSGAPDHVREGYSAQLEQAEIYKESVLSRLRKMDLVADMEGLVLEKLVEEGGIVAVPTAAFVIADTSQLELESDILVDYINKIKIGNRVEITGGPLEDTVLYGEVTKIAPIAKDVTSVLGVNQKRVTVKIKIDGASDLIKPGYSLDVRIITDSKDSVIVVPDSSVFDYEGKDCVFVVENGKAKLRHISLGMEGDGSVEVLSGLEEGEIILSRPDNSIFEGSRIKQQAWAEDQACYA
jgi:HlyD family secretion protein